VAQITRNSAIANVSAKTSPRTRPEPTVKSAAKLAASDKTLPHKTFNATSLCPSHPPGTCLGGPSTQEGEHDDRGEESKGAGHQGSVGR
jgi:hypothetical protein